jgi:hypothetical protein
MKKILFVLLFFPLIVIAENEEIQFIKNDTDLKVLEFNGAQGTRYNTNFEVKNNTNDVQIVVLKVKEFQNNNSISQVKFFINDLADEYSEIIRQNNNNVILFCEKYAAKEENVKIWCKGNDTIDVSLKARESVEILAVVDIDDKAQSGSTQFVLMTDNNILDDLQLVYKIPKKNVISLIIDRIVLEKEFDKFDFKEWIDANFQEKYKVNILIKNNGSETTNYKYCVDVVSVLTKEHVSFCKDAIINYGDVKNHNLEITVPRFGGVEIIGYLKYEDENGKIKEQRSESIEFVSFQVQLAIMFIIIICSCVVCILLYKYTIKNMFGFKKKKKQDKKKNTELYVVKDTDNIISIAQVYGVSWKELAKFNDIQPPYILISGETIEVPVQKKVTTESEVESEVESEQKTQNEQTQVSVDANMDMTAKQVKQQQSTMIEDETVITDDTIVQKEKVNNVNNDAKNKIENKKAEKNIMYASPKNMLTQTASEPTTRAIDIDWMREDEVIYKEEMQTQEKKMKTRFTLISVVIVIVIGLAIWWGVTWFMSQQNQQNVSVDNLIENQESVTISETEKLEVNETEQDVQTDIVTNTQTEENVEELNENIEQSEDTSNDDANNDTELNSKENIIIQVLNAGSQVGAAGLVTNDFKEKGYKTTTAQNAKNDYNGVVIYYKAENKDVLNDVSAIVDSKYGQQTNEESDDVTNKYNADFVVVLGS